MAPAQHIITFTQFHAWNGGQNVTAAQAAPYLSWAANPAESYYPTIHAAGIKAYDYTDATIAYSCGGCSEDWNDLQAHPQYISRDCSGQIIGSGSSGEYIDLTRTGWYPFYNNWINHNEGLVAPLHFDAEFADDADSHAWDGKDPCGVPEATFTAAIGAMLGQTSTPMIFNGLSVSDTQPDTRSLYNHANVIGGMAEQCYDGTGSSWLNNETDEIYAAQIAHKMFVCYSNNSGPANSSRAARLYIIASLLLTYDSKSALFENFGVADPQGLKVMPETGLVPANPAFPTPSSIGGLAVGGVYAREYNDCFYRGVDEGPCAAVVNSGNSNEALPYAGKYTHTLVLLGGGVLEGGMAFVNGPAPPANIAAGSGIVVFQ